MAQLVKNPPAMRETWVQSLGWEDLLEKEMASAEIMFVLLTLVSSLQSVCIYMCDVFNGSLL